MKFESISQLIEIICLAQGLIIGCYFILERKNRSINFLGLFLLTYCAPSISYFIREMGMLKTNPSLLFLPGGFYFMIMPLYFLYIESFIYKIGRTAVLKHLLAGLIEFSILLVLFLLPTSTSIPIFYKYEWFYNMVYGFLLPVFYFSYLVCIFYRFKIYNKNLLQINFNTTVNVCWLQKLTILLMVLCVFRFTVSNIIKLDTYKEMISIVNSILALIFIYLISIFGIRNRSILELNHNIPKTSNKKNEELEESDFLKLKELVEKEQLFKNTNLSIYVLSELSGLSVRKISQLINYFHENNFNSFINSFRINEAKKMINSKDFKHYTIEAIAKEVGFNSKSSFNTYFKNQEGMTPTAYKKMSKMNMNNMEMSTF